MTCRKWYFVIGGGDMTVLELVKYLGKSAMSDPTTALDIKRWLMYSKE